MYVIPFLFFCCFFNPSRVQELPRVDLFVTTADHVLEPPIITLNTVLSLLALDYPANKLACYVSDDACSVFTFYALVEASKFAKFWVPFCKKYNIQVRAPFRYFSQVTESEEGSPEFKQEWLQMKVSNVKQSYPDMIDTCFWISTMNRKMVLSAVFCCRICMTILAEKLKM